MVTKNEEDNCIYFLIYLCILWALVCFLSFLFILTHSHLSGSQELEKEIEKPDVEEINRKVWN